MLFFQIILIIYFLSSVQPDNGINQKTMDAEFRKAYKDFDFVDFLTLNDTEQTKLCWMMWDKKPNMNEQPECKSSMSDTERTVSCMEKNGKSSKNLSALIVLSCVCDVVSNLKPGEMLTPKPDNVFHLAWAKPKKIFVLKAKNISESETLLQVKNYHCNVELDFF